MGRNAELEPRLRDAERGLRAREQAGLAAQTDPEVRRQWGELACQRSLASFYRGELEMAAEHARQVQALTPLVNAASN